MSKPVRVCCTESASSPAWASAASSARRSSRTWPVAAAALALRSSLVRLPADLSPASAPPCARLSADSRLVSDSTTALPQIGQQPCASVALAPGRRAQQHRNTAATAGGTERVEDQSSLRFDSAVLGPLATTPPP